MKKYLLLIAVTSIVLLSAYQVNDVPITHEESIRRHFFVRNGTDHYDIYNYFNITVIDGYDSVTSFQPSLMHYAALLLILSVVLMYIEAGKDV